MSNEVLKQKMQEETETVKHLTRIGKKIQEVTNFLAGHSYCIHSAIDKIEGNPPIATEGEKDKDCLPSGFIPQMEALIDRLLAIDSSLSAAIMRINKII